MKKGIIFIIFSSILIANISGKKVFETYCWGCHHQTAVAFGPPFEQIASKRKASEIRAMIADPAAVSKIFGYRRNAMPAFKLKEDELEAITQYILSYKPKDNNGTNPTDANITDSNTTKAK